jgi:hypothetical protein
MQSQEYRWYSMDHSTQEGKPSTTYQTWAARVVSGHSARRLQRNKEILDAMSYADSELFRLTLRYSGNFG